MEKDLHIPQQTSNPRTPWDALSIQEKSEMMRVAIDNGILKLSDIKDKYNEFAKGGYIPSNEMKERITTWEGKAMTGAKDPLSGKYLKNDTFEAEAERFTQALPESIRDKVLNNPELADNLYSYSYNVGAGAFKKRVVPALERYYSGKSSPQEIAHSMWASGDNKLRGLRRRRDAEKAGVMNALTSEPIEVPVSTFVYNPYQFSQANTTLYPTMVPDESSYVTAHQLTEAERRKQKLQEHIEAIENFNNLMQLVGIQNNPLPSFVSTNPLLGLMGQSYAEGGSIHIKPENRGKFTKLKERTGHSASWFKEHGTPAQKKMATFALNSRHWKHGLGGNLYGDGGDFWDTLKTGIQKARNKVKEWGLDKSPMDHLVSRITTAAKDIKDNKNSELSIPVSVALNAGRIVGVNKTTKGSTNDTHYRQNLYNLIDPTDAIPESFEDVAKHVRATIKAKSNEDYPYRRVHADKAADAAWAKRLGLPYDNTVLIDNPDESVHLADYLENEIPTDTTFIKTRIADNEKLRNKTYGPDRRKIEAALNIDKAALNSLRHTYKTGEPVEMNEFSHVNRHLLNNGETTPLNLLHRYTIQYNKGNNTMDYRDIYDFDGFEDYIPGKPFNIRGSINLNKKK